MMRNHLEKKFCFFSNAFSLAKGRNRDFSPAGE